MILLDFGLQFLVLSEFLGRTPCVYKEWIDGTVSGLNMGILLFRISVLYAAFSKVQLA
jgi:hypothetical protein